MLGAARTERCGVGPGRVVRTGRRVVRHWRRHPTPSQPGRAASPVTGRGPPPPHKVHPRPAATTDHGTYRRAWPLLEGLLQFPGSPAGQSGAGRGGLAYEFAPAAPRPRPAGRQRVQRRAVLDVNHDLPKRNRSGRPLNCCHEGRRSREPSRSFGGNAVLCTVHWNNAHALPTPASLAGEGFRERASAATPARPRTPPQQRALRQARHGAGPRALPYAAQTIFRAHAAATRAARQVPFKNAPGMT